MSTVAPVIEPSLSQPTEKPVLDYSAPALKKKFGKNIWALGDQILISGTNFATGVLTARAMHASPAEFGTFSVVYGVLLLCNILQSTLITQAHNVLGATLSGKNYREYTGSTAWQQVIIVLIEALLTVPIAIFAYMKGWSSAAMLVALIPSIVAWQLQEFVRRVLYTEGRYGDAFINDIISYGGQTLVIVGLYAASLYGGRPFTGANALYALAITSAIAAAFGAWQLRHSVAKSEKLEADVRENWHFGKWLVGGELMGWASSLHMQVWWAALLIGTIASADLRAAQILFGPTRVITFFLGTVLPIRFARTLHNEGMDALRKNVRGVYAIMVPAVGAYCLLLAIFPKPLLNLVYGPEYAASAAMVLKLYSLSAFLSYMQMVLAAALTAARRTRPIFVCSFVGCGIALVMGPLCIKLLGANGAIINIIVTTLVVTVLYYRAYLEPEEAPAPQADARPGFPVIMENSTEAPQ